MNFNRELTHAEREAMIHSAIGNQALAGIHISREQAEAVFERAIREPLLDLDLPERDEGVHSEIPLA